MCEICDMQKEIEKLMEELSQLKLEGEIAAREFQLALKSGDAAARERAIIKIVGRTDVLLRKTIDAFDLTSKMEAAAEMARSQSIMNIFSQGSRHH